MMRGFVLGGLLLSVAYSYEFEAKIRAIWDDMDTYPTDGKVFIEEVQLFFSNISGVNEEVHIYNFDYWWGNRYGDSRNVTSYLFSKWDVSPTPPDGLLTADDLFGVYSGIETNDPDSLGFLDFFWEFHPYMVKLYNEINYLARGSIIG